MHIKKKDKRVRKKFCCNFVAFFDSNLFYYGQTYEEAKQHKKKNFIWCFFTKYILDENATTNKNPSFRSKKETSNGERVSE